jgi:hypothetical protein
VKRQLLASALAAVFLSAASSFAATAPPTSASDPALTSFSRWLDANRPGYGCDEGPAPFRNKTVEAAYPGQRFYYVLTYTRGIQPPFENSVSLVAAVDDIGHVVPFLPGTPASYGRGLKRIKSSKDARLAGAAVMIVASCGERRWPIAPERVKVKKSSKGWTATYFYDSYSSSWVSFDKKGAVLAFGGSSPPVP